jgi:hypothetical protein
VIQEVMGGCKNLADARQMGALTPEETSGNAAPDWRLRSTRLAVGVGIPECYRMAQRRKFASQLDHILSKNQASPALRAGDA